VFLFCCIDTPYLQNWKYWQGTFYTFLSCLTDISFSFSVNHCWIVLLHFLWPAIIAIYSQCKEVPSDYPFCVVLNLPEKVTNANVRGGKIMYQKWRHAVYDMQLLVTSLLVSTCCIKSAIYRDRRGVVLNGRLGRNNKKLNGYVLLYCDVHSTLAYKHARKMVNKRYVITRL
jgi:hypothetical protein